MIVKLRYEMNSNGEWYAEDEYTNISVTVCNTYGGWKIYTVDWFKHVYRPVYGTYRRACTSNKTSWQCKNVVEVAKRIKKIKGGLWKYRKLDNTFGETCVGFGTQEDVYAKINKLDKDRERSDRNRIRYEVKHNCKLPKRRGRSIF